MPSNPIADLSYRNYDGPILPPANRWWAIASMSMRQSIKKKGFWIWSAFSAYFYLILLVMLYIADAITNLPLGAKNPILQSIVWKDQFLNSFATSQLFLVIIALLIGAGTIANDNRANALLVYLSKPCTKLDYVIGKWLGIFIPITLVCLAPALFFYAYGLMSYRNYGFFSEDPWLLIKIVGMCMGAGTIHASLSLGISSLFNQGRLAGATYAGIYFISSFITKAMDMNSFFSVKSGHEPTVLVQRLYYCSVDGLQYGLAKLIMGTDGSGLFPNFGLAQGRQKSPMNGVQVPMPPASFILPFVIVVCVVSLFTAWHRVRAVEVVG